jgi:hypothetical protein
MYDTTTKKGVITFSYDSDTLFNDVCLLSAYMTKNIVMESASALDEFCITEDERDIYNECLKQSLPDVFESVLDMAACGDGAFSMDGGAVTISVKNNNAYTQGALAIVDSTLNDCIKYGALARFYATCMHDALLVLSRQKLDASLSQLKQRLFQLRKKPVTSQL